MIRWQFWQSEADGQVWLDNPDVQHAVVTFDRIDEVTGKVSSMRINVVTRGWLDKELACLLDRPGPSTLVLPSMIVLRDAKGPELRRLLDIALNSGGSLLGSLSRSE